MLLRHLVLLVLASMLPVFPAAAQGSVRTSMSSGAVNKGVPPKPKRRMTTEKLREAAIKAGPMRATNDQSHRTNFPDPKKSPQRITPGAYPWHFDITATYFYIGELATKNNPVPNTASSWDSAWDDNYGGYDAPILLIHGDRDYRILSSQSMAAFNAARLRGIPAKLLLFPDENTRLSKCKP